MMRRNDAVGFAILHSTHLGSAASRRVCASVAGLSRSISIPPDNLHRIHYSMIRNSRNVC